MPKQAVDVDLVLALRPDVVVTVTEQGAVLLDLESKYFYSVNPSGWCVLQLFEGGTTVARARETCRAWGAGAADATALDAFIATLEQEGLVKPTSTTSETPVESPPLWQAPTIEKHAEPLQRVMTSAFDPTLPLAE